MGCFSSEPSLVLFVVLGTKPAGAEGLLLETATCDVLSFDSKTNASDVTNGAAALSSGDVEK